MDVVIDSNREIQVLELVALQAILGPEGLQVHQPSVAAAVAVLGNPLAAAALQQEAVCSTATLETITATIHLEASNGHSLELHVALPPGYPGRDAPPRIEASSWTLQRQLPRACTDQVLEPLIAAAMAGGEGGVPGECLFELVEAARAWLETADAARGDNSCTEPNSSSSSGGRTESQEQEPQVTALLQLDHMRDRAAYTKTLHRWAAELHISGGVLWASSPRLILVLLVGGDRDVKEFVVRLKTRSVDVDSRGRPCKERMMTVLSQGPLPRSHVPLDHASSGSSSGGFREMEIASPEELAALLLSAGVPPGVVAGLSWRPG